MQMSDKRNLGGHFELRFWALIKHLQLGNKQFWIQHTQIRVKTLVTNF